MLKIHIFGFVLYPYRSLLSRGEGVVSVQPSIVDSGDIDQSKYHDMFICVLYNGMN